MTFRYARRTSQFENQVDPHTAAMVAKVGGIWYLDIPSPNTTVFSVLWPPSIALWGSLVLPYTLVVR